MLLTAVFLVIAAAGLVVLEALRRAALCRLFERALLRVAAADERHDP